MARAGVGGPDSAVQASDEAVTWAACVGRGPWHGFTTRVEAEAWANSNADGRAITVAPIALVGDEPVFRIDNQPWEVRHMRTGEVVKRCRTEAEAHAFVNRQQRKAQRFLNRPGMHGGISSSAWCDLAVCRAS